MKKFQSLGRNLSKEEQKRIMGGVVAGDNCNTYCGEGSGVVCNTGKCGYCVDAGNGQNPTKPGGDKMCALFPE